jgi:tetratricopeptide (TPR) repeat protein
VDRLLTPLLRRLYAFTVVFVTVYLAFLAWQYSSWNKDRLYQHLVSGSEAEQASAAFDLAYLRGEKQLLTALKAPSKSARAFATSSLWDLWTRSGGHRAFRQIQVANQAMERRAYANALETLTRLIEKYPDFAEGWNRRATLYCQMGHYEESVHDARKVVALNPNHFAAWQGMGICQIHLGNLEEACRCLHRALHITPHDRALQRCLGHCEQLLHLFSPSRQPAYDTI